MKTRKTVYKQRNHSHFVPMHQLSQKSPSETIKHKADHRETLKCSDGSETAILNVRKRLKSNFGHRAFISSARKQRTSFSSSNGIGAVQKAAKQPHMHTTITMR